MIVCKPKSASTTALVYFLILCYSITGVGSYNLFYNPGASILYYILFGLVTTVALGITIRLFFNYKIISVQKSKIQVEKPFLRSRKIFLLRQIQAVKEEKIKTYKSEYKLLNIQFENGFLEISNQEYTDYEKFKAYIDKHKPSKKKRKKTE